MKSAKTMLAQARQLAIEQGIRVVSDQAGHEIIGFAFTQGEISKIYQGDGFLLKTMRKHLDMWVALGAIIPVGKLYYIRLQPDDDEPIADLNEERRMREIRGDLDCRYVSWVSA